MNGTTRYFSSRGNREPQNKRNHHLGHNRSSRLMAPQWTWTSPGCLQKKQRKGRRPDYASAAESPDTWEGIAPPIGNSQHTHKRNLIRRLPQWKDHSPQYQRTRMSKISNQGRVFKTTRWASCPPSSQRNKTTGGK